MKKTFVNFLLVIFSSLVGLLLLELATRIALGLPVLSNQDWRDFLSQPSGYVDDQLGWVLRPNNRTTGKNAVNTLDYGIRKNKREIEEQLSQKAILAVGDSFTVGSEVEDDQSWPAYLERALGERVLNAGVGAYGVDQSIMQAERLIPLLDPKTVLIGALVPDDVQRVGYKSYGSPKPYFVKKDGAYIRMNNPVPEPVRTRLSEATWTARFRSGLAHLYVAHSIMSLVSPSWWYAKAGEAKLAKFEQVYEKAPNNPVFVSCFLLDRLSRILDQRNVRGVLVVQHGGWIYARHEARSYEANELVKCARRLGYDIVDEYDTLKRIADKSTEDLQRHYVMHANRTVYGHMSPEGNALVADLIAERLRQAPAERIQEKPERIAAGHGINLFTDEIVRSLANATNRLIPEPGAIPFGAVQRLGAGQVDGEHYGVMPWNNGSAGHYTLSLYLRSDSSDRLRLQIIDEDQNGGIVDFQMQDEIYNFTRIGAAEHMDLHIEKIDDHWKRLSFVVALSGSKGIVIFQLLDEKGETAFGGADVSVRIQAPMIERGGTSSPWCAPGQCTGETGESDSKYEIVRGDGINRLSGILFTAMANAVGEKVQQQDGTDAQRISAAESTGEHYAALSWSGDGPGRYTASIFLKPDEEAAVRLQLIDAEANGATVFYNPSASEFLTTAVGLGSRTQFIVDRKSDGWSRLSLSVDIPSAQGSMVVQLAKPDGTTLFGGEKVSLMVKLPMVEWGSTASDWRAP